MHDRLRCDTLNCVPGVEERIRARLKALADAAGIQAPPLVVAPPPEEGEHAVPAWVIGRLRPKRIAVTVPLVVASPAEQDWYLASCLAWWVSPLPRRRWLLTFGTFLLPGVAHAFVPWSGSLPYGWLVAAAVGVVLPAVVLAWSTRWTRRAMEAVGLEVLAAAGHDPAVVARQAFGDRPPPRRGERMFSHVPGPEERIAAAESRAPRPAPLY